MSEPTIRQALNAEVIFTQDQIKRRAYEKAEKARRDHIAIMNYAISQGMAKGEAKGEAKGMAKGMAKGIAEGEAKGEAQATERIAAAMLQNGMQPEVVAELSGLPLAAVQKLAQK